MGKGTITKTQAASLVVKYSQSYKNELNNKNLLFLCLDKHKNPVFYEFSFRERNYMHLTGLVPVVFRDINGALHKLTANEFYDKCISGTLTDVQFEFKKDGTTPLKLTLLPQILTKNLSAKMIGNYDKYTPLLQTDKLVGKIDGVIGFEVDAKEGIYLPNTLLKANIKDLTNNTNRIIAAFRKDKNAEKYEELTYTAKNIEWDKVKSRLPKEYIYLKKLLPSDTPPKTELDEPEILPEKENASQSEDSLSSAESLSTISISDECVKTYEDAYENLSKLHKKIMNSVEYSDLDEESLESISNDEITV